MKGSVLAADRWVDPAAASLRIWNAADAQLGANEAKRTRGMLRRPRFSGEAPRGTCVPLPGHALLYGSMIGTALITRTLVFSNTNRLPRASLVEGYSPQRRCAAASMAWRQRRPGKS